MFKMQWNEDGGPPVAQPTRKGFGQKVIGPMAALSVNGHADIEYRPTGLAWTLTAPVANTLERGRTEQPEPHAKS